MALIDGKFVITSEDFAVALDASDPTDAWLLNEDGTTSLADDDDISKYTIAGYWPRYLFRAGSAHTHLSKFDDEESALHALNIAVSQNFTRE